MEPRDFYEIITLVGFIALFAGAGVGGYLFGRFHDRPPANRARRRVRAADAAPDRADLQ